MMTLEELLTNPPPAWGCKRLPGYSYKLAHSNYAMDVAFAASEADIDESRMSVTIPFASGLRRDGVGDLLEIGGIDTTRHRMNPIVLFDHGKKYELPVATAEDPDTGEYCVRIDPENKIARVKAFFYQGQKSLGSAGYDHAVFCEQLFDLIVKKFIRAGSIGYQVVEADPLHADYSRGIPQGMHLKRILMLEASAVVLPANMDTTRKEMVREVLSMKRLCGRPLSPILVKSLSGYGEKAGLQKKARAAGAATRKWKKEPSSENADKASKSTRRYSEETYANRQGDQTDNHTRSRIQAIDAKNGASQGPRKRHAEIKKKRNGAPHPPLIPKGHHRNLKDPEYAAVHEAAESGDHVAAHARKDRAMELGGKALRPRRDDYDPDDPRSRGPQSRDTSSKVGSNPIHKKSMKSLREQYGKAMNRDIYRDSSGGAGKDPSVQRRDAQRQEDGDDLAVRTGQTEAITDAVAKTEGHRGKRSVQKETALRNRVERNVRNGVPRVSDQMRNQSRNIPRNDGKALPHPNQRFRTGGQRRHSELHSWKDPLKVRKKPTHIAEYASGGPHPDPYGDHGPEINSAGIRSPHADPYGEKGIRRKGRVARTLSKKTAKLTLSHAKERAVHMKDPEYRQLHNDAENGDKLSASARDDYHEERGGTRRQMARDAFKTSQQAERRYDHEQVKSEKRGGMTARGNRAEIRRDNAARSKNTKALQAKDQPTRQADAPTNKGKAPPQEERTRINPHQSELHERGREKIRDRRYDKVINSHIAAKRKGRPQVAPMNEAGKALIAENARQTKALAEATGNLNKLLETLG